jgi:hypothetical protein
MLVKTLQNLLLHRYTIIEEKLCYKYAAPNDSYVCTYAAGTLPTSQNETIVASLPLH